MVPEIALMQTLWPSLSRFTQFYFSIFGEAYLDGGAFAVVVFALVFGAFWRYLWLALRGQFSKPTAIAIYAVSLPVMVAYLRGGVGGDYYRQLIFTVPIIALGMFATAHRTMPAPLSPRNSRAEVAARS
jgi:hypothetical protein